MKTIIYFLLVCFLFVCPLFSEDTPESLYQQTEALYNQIKDEGPSIKNIPKYKEISRLLKEITDKNPEDKELLKKTYQLLITSYDRQAKYPEKHLSLIKYAKLISNNDKEKTSQVIQEEIDELYRQGEISEAKLLYKKFQSVLGNL